MLSIDITDRQVKLVRGSLSGTKIRVSEVDVRDLGEGFVSNGYIGDIPMVAGEITDMITTRGIKDKEAIVCINSGAILYKELILPKPKRITNTSAIEAMILNNMGISNEYNISYSIVGEAEDEEKNSMIKVIATACPQRMVDGYIRLFTHLGLSLKQINISNNCISRLIINTAKLALSMPLMLVQIDNEFLNINLYEEGQVAISRYIKIDASDYNNAPDFINQAVYDNLFRMIQFNQSRKGAKPLKEIMFYGVIKDFISLTNAISSFNVPSHILSLPNNVVTFCELDFSIYANAIGAFYKINKGLDHVNLLDSTAVKEKKGINKFIITIVAAALASLAAVGVGYVVVDNINAGLTKQIQIKTDEIKDPEVQNRLSILNQKITILGNFEQYKSSVEQAKRLFDYQPKPVSLVVEKLLEPIEKDAKLKGIEFTGTLSINSYNVDVYYRCTDDTQPAAYVKALKEQGYFVGITYNGYTLEQKTDDNGAAVVEQNDKDKAYNFSLTMQLKGGNAIETD